MNGKYKGGGCGCGASKSLGFPQTGGQKVASMKRYSEEPSVNTGFSNNSGLFKTKSSKSQSMKRRNSNMQQGEMPMANSFVGGGDIISDALSAMSGTSPEETPLPANSGQVNILDTGYPPAASIVNNPTVSTPNVAVPSTPSTPTVSNSPVTTDESLINPPLEYQEQKPKENSGGIMGALKGAFGLNSGTTTNTTATTGGRRTRRSKKGSKKTKKVKKAKKTKKSRK